MKLFGIFIFLFFYSFISAQSTSVGGDIRVKNIIFKDSFTLDNFPILPESILIFSGNKPLDNRSFKINYMTATMYSSERFMDSLRVYYRVIPVYRSNLLIPRNRSKNGLSTSYSRMTISGMKADNVPNELEYSGSFVRGITVGSNQGSAINSGFNLNMSGKLVNGLEISATMTDANIPIQPEGNSASIQEFDRIYIQLKKDSHKIIMGDFDMSELPSNYFLKVNRKLQGIQYQNSLPIFVKNKSQHTTLGFGAMAAITRGTFARNVLSVQENNQGPYKLFGNNGESFIIIIAGTERVYVNGQLMKRGSDGDYIVNYNMGEVIFTPNRLITRDLRVIVEFQYSDRNYFRYTLEGHVQFQNEKLKLYSQIFTENDNKNQQINYNLNKNQIQRLAAIGNQIDSAIIPSETEVTWESSRITYQKKDTMVRGMSFSILKWAESISSPVYQVVFTLRGINNGNYILKSSAANGSVYEWVAPINGIPQGIYEPSIKISTPKTQLQWSSGGEVHWNQSNHSKFEVSYSDHDLNAFSDIDQDQNKGIGVRLQHEIIKKIDTVRTISILLGQEYSSAHFSPLTRYRNNEFQRDWSLNLPIRNEKEQSLSNVGLVFQSPKMYGFLQSTFFFIPQYYNGSQSSLDWRWREKRFSIQTYQNLLNVSLADSSTLFYRPKFSIGYETLNKMSALELGFFHEWKQVGNVNMSLLPSSFLWQNYNLIWNQKLSKQHSWQFQYIYRTEQSSDGFAFQSPHTTSHTFSWTGHSTFTDNHSFSYILKYRNFSTNLLQNELAHNYLSRVDYNGSIGNGFIRINSNYEIKAGREQKMQMTYVKSPNGYGNYAWKDLNLNGVFELNEAYVSPIMTENNYVRFFVVLPEFIPANEVQFSQNINIIPKAIFYDKLGWRKWFNKFLYQFRLDIHRKVRLDDAFGVLDFGNPFGIHQDSLLIFSRDNMFHQLSFQKFENKIGLDVEWTSSNTRNLLSNGIEGFKTNIFSLKSRIELGRLITMFNKISNGYKSNSSEFFNERNFKIVENSIENTWTCLINRNMKLNLNANYAFKSSGIQFAVIQQGELEWKFARKNDGLIESRFSLVNINYESNTINPQVELAMLNGIQKGLNYIWNITLGQKITKFIQLNVIYNGRKNTNSDQFIHSGNVEARAIF